MIFQLANSCSKQFYSKTKVRIDQAPEKGFYYLDCKRKSDDFSNLLQENPGYLNLDRSISKIFTRIIQQFKSRAKTYRLDFCWKIDLAPIEGDVIEGRHGICPLVEKWIQNMNRIRNKYLLSSGLLRMSSLPISISNSLSNTACGISSVETDTTSLNAATCKVSAWDVRRRATNLSFCDLSIAKEVTYIASDLKVQTTAQDVRAVTEKLTPSLGLTPLSVFAANIAWAYKGQGILHQNPIIYCKTQILKTADATQ